MKLRKIFGDRLLRWLRFFKPYQGDVVKRPRSCSKKAWFYRRKGQLTLASQLYVVIGS